MKGHNRFVNLTFIRSSFPFLSRWLKEKESQEGMNDRSVSLPHNSYTIIVIHFSFVNSIETRRKGDKIKHILCAYMIDVLCLTHSH